MHACCIMHARSMHACCIMHARSMHACCIMQTRSMHACCIMHARSMHACCIMHARSMHACCIMQTRPGPSRLPCGLYLHVLVLYRYMSPRPLHASTRGSGDTLGSATLQTSNSIRLSHRRRLEARIAQTHTQATRSSSDRVQGASLSCCIAVKVLVGRSRAYTYWLIRPA